MPIESQVSIHGISEFGEWTANSTAAGGVTSTYNSDNVYTESSWGYTSEEGARVVPSVTRVEQRSGQSASLIDSFIESVGAQLEVNLLSGHLTNLKRMLGLPDTALTGDLTSPTDEILVVDGSALGTVEQQLYMKTMGPIGPRTYYFPRAKVASFPELQHTRTDYFEPNATFDLYEEDVGNLLMWIEDAAA